MVEVDRVDVGQVHEGLDLDRARLARLDRGQLLVGQDHLLARRGRRSGRPPPRDLDVLLRAEAPLLDPHLVLLVQLVEVVVEVARRAHQLHGHVDEAEAERAAPQRARPISASPRRSPRAQRPDRRRARAPPARPGRSPPLGLALDQLEHRLAVGVVVDARARSPRWSESTACAAISTSRFAGLLLRASMSSSSRGDDLVVEAQGVQRDHVVERPHAPPGTRGRGR